MGASIAIQLREDCRTPQLATGNGTAKVDGIAPGVAVSLVDQLCYRELRKSEIAEEFRAIEKRALVSLCRQVDVLGRSVTLLGEIVAFQDIETLDEGDAARGRRRSADNVVPTVGATNWLALLYFIVCKVFRGDQASALLNRVGYLACHRPVVEVIGIAGDALQGLRQLRLLEYFTRLIVVAVALENAVRLRKLRQIGIVKGRGLVVVENETLSRQPDRRLHYLLQRETSPMSLGVAESGHRAGNGDRFVAYRAHVQDDIAPAVEIHAGSSLRGCLLAIVEKVHLPIRPAEEQEAAPTDIARFGIDHLQREGDGHGRVHRISSLLHDRYSGFGSLRMHRGYHGLGRVRRMHDIGG